MYLTRALSLSLSLSLALSMQLRLCWPGPQLEEHEPHLSCTTRTTQQQPMIQSKHLVRQIYLVYECSWCTTVSDVGMSLSIGTSWHFYCFWMGFFHEGLASDPLATVNGISSCFTSQGTHRRDREWFCLEYSLKLALLLPNIEHWYSVRFFVLS